MSQQLTTVACLPFGPVKHAENRVRRPVLGVPGLFHLSAYQQLIAEQSTQLSRRIMAPLTAIHIVTERPPAIRLSVIAWMIRIKPSIPPSLLSSSSSPAVCSAGRPGQRACLAL